MGAGLSKWKREHTVLFWVLVVLLPLGIIALVIVGVGLIFGVNLLVKKGKEKKYGVTDDEIINNFKLRRSKYTEDIKNKKADITALVDVTSKKGLRKRNKLRNDVKKIVTTYLNDVVISLKLHIKNITDDILITNTKVNIHNVQTALKIHNKRDVTSNHRWANMENSIIVYTGIDYTKMMSE